jgi:hypothetical protein
MIDSRQTHEFFDTAAKVLLRCTVFGFVFILLWFMLYMLAPGPMYDQGKWFGLSPHEIDLMHYGGMAFVKMCVLVFFLFPYLSIRLVLRGKSTQSAA